MKKCLLLFPAFLIIFPIVNFAGWQVAQPKTTIIPREPFFEAGRHLKHPLPSLPPASCANKPFLNRFPRVGHPTTVYAVSVSGSLKENLERIMGRYHWRVVWKAPYDYNFDGRVTGSSLPHVIQKLVQPFPLQARMYLSNRTLAVVPRFHTGK